MRMEDDYRLGNIIDAWFGRAHVVRRKACGFEDMLGRSHGTFGNFLGTYEPRFLIEAPPAHFLKCAGEWWWCYFIENVTAVYPTFNDALRDAIRAYGRCIEPSSPGTCVIHMRVGDYLHHAARIGIDDILHASSLLRATPERFEIVNGGKRFRASSELLATSETLLRDLCTALRGRFPEAVVELVDSDNADTDFFRMVMAPMLITGAGSFAICAAAANRNQRLTPALRNLNFVHEGGVEPSHLYEEWSTYRCSTLPHEGSRSPGA